MKPVGKRYKSRLLRQSVEMREEGHGTEVIHVGSGGYEAVVEEIVVIATIARDCHVMEKKTI